MNISLSPFAPENLVPRDRFGRPVPRQPARPPHSGCTWCLFTGFLPLSTVASIYSYLQPSLDQSRVYQITKLCTDGVHCRRGYAGIGPLVLKVVPVTGAAFSGITMDQTFHSLLFSHAQFWYEVGMCGSYSIGGKTYTTSRSGANGYGLAMDSLSSSCSGI